MNKPITYAYLETTNHCNLNCSFCNREDVIGPLKHMPVLEFRGMLERLKNEPIMEAKLMGMGEPFLHPHFDKICETFKEYFPSAYTIVATNCQYKIRDSFRNTLENIDMLYLSIDGWGDNYERDRAPAKWHKLWKFLDQLKDVDRKGCKIVINYVVNPDNVDDIQRVYDEIYIPYELEEFRINIAQSWSEDESMVGGYSESQIEYLKNNWKDCIRGNHEWDYEDCFWPKNAVYTTVEGNVKVCCMNTSAESFGNLFVDDIHDIHSTERFQEVLIGCSTNNPTSHCKNCSYKELVPILKKIKG